MLKALLALPIVLAVSGCPKGGAITCPTFVGYSDAFLAATEKEIAKIENDAPHVVEMLNDYGVERDAIRECLRRQKASRK